MDPEQNRFRAKCWSTATASKLSPKAAIGFPKESGIEVIDGGGHCLMPGLVEAHGHISFTDVAKLTDLGEIPPEEHVLKTMHNARLLLDSGFTSVYSAASAKPRIEVVIRNEINAGRIPGPESAQLPARLRLPVVSETSGCCTFIVMVWRQLPTASTRCERRCLFSREGSTRSS